MMPLVALAVLVGGFLVAAQAPIYARMARDLGGALPAATLAFAIGTAGLTVAMVLRNGPWPQREQLAAVPVWAWAGGLIGVFVVLVSIRAVPRLGVAGYMVLFIFGQLLAGLIYDRLGAFGLPARPAAPINLAGVFMVGAGTLLAVWR